ncbi:DUF305 domain-containing protein [Antarcticibacterium flavum]|uniref:DUF305 domain-containing protein n=1 Tax=Antarcticibacterium flavum TaxID=2058175 RepID=A0A5B7X686_9FLAO|nr:MULTISPECIES: DUF305 domain-containing protein [Antarcticibacterium]MCM4158510.1 hypothetical protein [Antarcticibacterium sp. W02-3]QCY70258.1 DUF305 domain-containing protein [Antarcticibacterium flavum]
MKKFKLCIASLAVFAMIFTSCSKEEEGISQAKKTTLSFEAIVNDLVSNRAASKQSLGDIPECSNDDPAFVRIILLQGGTEVVGTSNNPYRIDLASGQNFTVEDAALELDPGTYNLDHFSVYNADGDLIWLAPRGGDLANFVDTPLPLSIDLGAGVKKYVEVPVLCYDNRDVNQYGYLFFELDTNQAVEFCFFANYCDDSGRHFTANYSLDVWLGTDNTGIQLYNDLEPTVGVNDHGDFFASPLCVALPYNEGANEDYIYYEVTLLDWEANYDSVEHKVLSGTLNKNDIEAHFDGNDNIDYEHLRFNCVEEGVNEEYVAEMEAAIENMMEEINAIPYTGDPDYDFARKMIPHHRGEIALAEIELEYGHHEEMRNMAEQTLTSAPESINRLQNFLEQHGEPEPISDTQYIEEMEAAMEEMEVEMTSIPYTGDPDYDFARKMIPHHQGAIDLSLIELEYGVHEMTREEARMIIDSQQQGIVELESFIEEHGSPME